MSLRDRRGGGSISPVDVEAAPIASSILVVDDDVELLNLLELWLSSHGHLVTTCGRGERALELLDERSFDVVLVDVGLPGMSGIDFCAAAAAERTGLSVIVMTGLDNKDLAVAALRAGAADFLFKPLDMESLEARLNLILSQRKLAAEVRRLRDVVAADRGYAGLMGTSAAMKRVFEVIGRAAQTNAAVLISGESGTGKESVARALHSQGPRREGAFVSVDCRTVADGRLISGVLGQPGSSSAAGSGEDVLRQADGGTLFMREIGELGSTSQVQLLQAIEPGRAEVGAAAKGNTGPDVRVVATTDRDLDAAVEEGRFREDLFFCINVIQIRMPPLRARGNDVLQLAQHYLDLYAAQFEKQIVGLTPATADRLLAYDWPGNVRELRTSIERAAALTVSAEIGVDDLPDKIRDHTRAQLVLAGQDPGEFLSMEQVERRYLLHVLHAVGGNRSEAAKILGVDRKTLYRKLQRYTDAET